MADEPCRHFWGLRDFVEDNGRSEWRQEPMCQRACLKENYRGSDFPLALRYCTGQKEYTLLAFRSLLLSFSYRKGYVSLEDYTSFLIDKESENIKTSDDIESGFQALAEGKAYITKEDMKQVRFLLLLC